ncbi:diadenylate cyclase [Iamia sp.]|uniref:diadenylate cyclase n=1 Tax=Iamia sp. TaxID=2722710 RepID=UPI002B8580AF|nr:diadenylate cyclase [Iamia sp.]HXH57342.1 diadenylate cyclase [Iamia sp.]
MQRDHRPAPARRRRLVEEMAEVGLGLDGSGPDHDLVLDELDYALRPRVHERRVPSFGAIVAPTTDAAGWEATTGLAVDRRDVGARPTAGARFYADGLSSWLIRWDADRDEGAVFDRPAGSERDLVVLAEAMGATLVQRHPSGTVRVVGSFGVFRWDGLRWHHEPLVSSWIDAVSAGATDGERDVVETLLEFAVHDLGARNIGATLLYRPADAPGPSLEARLPLPPPLAIGHPPDLAPLRHVMGQVDGATLFDGEGVVRHIGVRLVPSVEAETGVAGYRGMRHTAARRYSFDDPGATVIVVSEDGPVTVWRAGELLAASAADAPEA